ncbi:MAG: CDP-glycerol glycerophosphotransferase family protein [Kurthia gibsonii]
MFILEQNKNTFHITLEELSQGAYQYILLKNRECVITIPITSLQVTIEERYFEQWFEQYGTTDAILTIAYLYPLEDEEQALRKDRVVEVDGELFEQRYRLFKPHRMQLELKDLHTFQLNGHTIDPHFTKEGYLVFSFDANKRATDYYAARKLTKIHPTKDYLHLQAQLSVRNLPLTSIELELQSRNTGESSFVGVEAKLVKMQKKKSGYVYHYELNVKAQESIRTLLKIVNAQFDEDVWDLWWVLRQKDVQDVARVRCGMPRIIVEQLMKGQINIADSQYVHNFVPYLTVKGRNLSFFYNQYTKEEFEMYQKVLKKGRVKKANERPIWIVGERPYKAQDNGLRFFEYLRTQHPEIDAYYIIREDSPERVNVEPYGNLLDYRSKEHFDLLVKADYICGTHHPDFLYPNRSKEFMKCIRAKQIFLQHGVLGVKNISGFYSKKMKDFQTDLFITSSEREKDIVVRDLNYEEYEVAVTGLPRFSRLFTDDIEVKKQVLIIPTWRDWLTTNDKFLKSEYLERYTELLHNDRLLALKNQGVELLFCLHPNMQQFVDYFDIPEEITVIRQGDRLVQDLLKESALLITDYSSVAFDFSFLHKPVIYYQFDRDHFLGKYPSHLDIDATLPGFITDDGEEVVNEILRSYEANFQMSDHYKELANQFIANRDVYSNDRIFEAIQKMPKKKPIYDTLKHHQVYDASMRKFRKSKKYFSAMRKMYKVMSKTLKKDPKLILFESGVGKQISDSPKNIYDELVKRNSDYRYIWVYNGKDEFKKSHTKVIKRLSPEYFYYLAKAKFWINNQNFPSYLKKNSKQTYIQTWHGTPLKKMQNDVEDFKGKDPGYLARVNQAVKQWDYLISPSPYATKAFRSAFQFKKEVLEVGYPRNDIFYHPEEQKQYIEQVRLKYNIPKDKKVLLYAPTFRDDDLDENGKHIFNMQLDLQKLYEQFGDEYVILMRTHVIVGNRLPIPLEYRHFVINVSRYHDIQHLYLIADVCMTDYSSVMFDFAHTRRPLLFFTYDFDHYKENLRGFYMDFEKEAPGPLLRNTDDLVDALSNIEEMTKTYAEKYAAFHEKYCGLEDGHAAEKIVDCFFPDARK